MKGLINRLVREELAKTNKFSQLVSGLSANPVDGKPGLYYFTLGPSRLVFKKGNGKSVELELIETNSETGQGHAKNIMSKFLSGTDTLKLPVELIISPRNANTDFNKLASFYQKYGFEFTDMGGFASDFEMIRYPKR